MGWKMEPKNPRLDWKLIYNRSFIMEGSFKRDMVDNAFNSMKSLPLPFESNALHGKAATTLKLESKNPLTASIPLSVE